ncbi:hypothetical protein EX30DRAFT_348783 [Ascodesmis nigricans]|uniref:Uncharacterized protein n=1 Tax=Ascodesmis nigricans TaxID=341454 RepID=A0A4S2MX43_9PEZI|nr:hypothetical protein EX30DRAFT_348783 [Ascodesmis nigricans]
MTLLNSTHILLNTSIPPHAQPATLHVPTSKYPGPFTHLINVIFAIILAYHLHLLNSPPPRPAAPMQNYKHWFSRTPITISHPFRHSQHSRQSLADSIKTDRQASIDAPPRYKDVGKDRPPPYTRRDLLSSFFETRSELDEEFRAGVEEWWGGSTARNRAEEISRWYLEF